MCDPPVGDLAGVVDLFFSTTGGEEFSFDFLSLGLPTRSIDSPFFFELFTIPSTEFAV